MVVCPDCGKNVEADFGMTTCSSCGAVFMVEYDGTVQPPSEEVNGEEGLDAEEMESAEPEEATPEDGDLSGAMSEPGPESSWENEEQVAESSKDEEYSENFLDQLSDTEPENEAEASSDPLGIVGFDQSSASTLAEGPYYYDVQISGLDSLQMKQEILQALSDKRFNFSTDQLKKNIRDGQLKIENINPVKAVLVVLKLQNYDVEVEWQQKLYTDESVQKDLEE